MRVKFRHVKSKNDAAITEYESEVHNIQAIPVSLENRLAGSAPMIAMSTLFMVSLPDGGFLWKKMEECREVKTNNSLQP